MLAKKIVQHWITPAVSTTLNDKHVSKPFSVWLTRLILFYCINAFLQISILEI